MRYAAGGAVVILALGVLAVVGGVFDPSREERARDWVEREYGAKLGACEQREGDRFECELEQPSPELLDRLGRPAGSASACSCSRTPVWCSTATHPVGPAERHLHFADAEGRAAGRHGVDRAPGDGDRPATTPSSSSSPPRRARSRSTASRRSRQVGGDLTELLERARARRRPQRGRRLRRPSAPRSGRSSAGSTSRWRTRRASSRRGELCLAARERGGGRLLPVDSEHSAALPVPRRTRACDRRLARADRVRRALPRAQPRGARRRHPGTRRSPTRRGTWAPRSRSTRPRSRTRASS